MSTTELTWSKSSYSGDGDGNCVEIAHTPATWAGFLTYVAK